MMEREAWVAGEQAQAYPSGIRDAITRLGSEAEHSTRKGQEKVPDGTSRPLGCSMTTQA